MRAALASYVEKHDVLCCRVGGRPGDPCVDVKCALNANHTASRTKLALHAQRASDVPVNFY
jgi:hypothetical protein